MKSLNYFFNPHMKLMTLSSIKFVAQHSLTFISKIENPSCLMSMKDNPGLWARLLLVSLLPLRYLLSGSGILSALVPMRPAGRKSAFAFILFLSLLLPKFPVSNEPLDYSNSI